MSVPLDVRIVLDLMMRSERQGVTGDSRTSKFFKALFYFSFERFGYLMQERFNTLSRCIPMVFSVGLSL